jgi:oligopeptide transport system substrate-binding protein
LRKKIFGLLLVGLLALVLFACDSKEDQIKKALDLIGVPSGVIEDFELELASGDVTFEWSSNNSALKIGTASGGKVTVEVTRPANDVSVELTVKGTLGKVSLDKKFTVLVYGSSRPVVDITEEEVSKVQAELELPGRTSKNLELNAINSKIPVGVELTWSSSNTDVIKADGTVTRPAGTGTGVKMTATLAAETESGETIQKQREFFVFVYGTDVDVNGVYNTAFGEVVTLNPLNSTGSSDSDVYSMLVSYLYDTDYNWTKAIKEGKAAYPGDFSQVRDRKAVVDPNDGKIEMPYLSRMYYLGMAAAFPWSVDHESDFDLGFGELDETLSKEKQDDEWIIKLRKDLKFADGTPITVDTYEYSFKQYLDGKQNNERANYLYNGDYIPLVNGEGYFKQGRPKDEKNPDGEKWPAVSWSEVGFEKIDDYTFKITLTGPKTQWHVMTYLGIINLVHPERFEAGFNAERTITSYGSITNIPVSYGPYVLQSWEDDVKFTFVRNENYVKAYEYTIKTINGPIIKDQKDRVNEFKAGNLDAAGVGGEFWKEFMDHPNLYVSPSNSFYRFAISLDRSGGTSGKTAAPILKQADFRRALYLATDRLDYTTEVQAPSEPALGLLSNIHQVSEWATGAYERSAVALQQLEDLGLSPSTGGYNPEEAKDLFLEAYTKAVQAGDYTAGQEVVIEFSFYDAGSNLKMANWVKAQYEKVFNKTVKYNGVDVPFKVELNSMPQAQFVAARDSGDFDMCFTGMSGATFQATFGMGYIFSRTFSTFLAGRGHDTGNLEVEADIIYLHDLLSSKPEAELEDHEIAFLEAVDENGTFKGTFDELFTLFSDTGNFNVDYVGQQEDLTNITAALEGALLKQGICVPLFSATTAAVYSEKVIRMAPAYSLFMGWGGLPYTHMKAN